MSREYTDQDDNTFRLVPYPYKKGDRACVGCHLNFGNSKACQKAPTCTPEGLRGHNVWRDVAVLDYNKEKPNA